MCGIVGYAGVSGGLSGAALQRMRDALSHRGPDGAEAIRWRGDGRLAADHELAETGLGHRRLSIIDLTDAGAQPMSNEDGTLWITYNGEFYNFGDYRKDLEEKGHVFRSHCDTETILHLYEEHGLEKTLERMNGMFAFGLWDARRGELTLARDRLGKKPLYYAHLADGSILFASEIKALLASGKIDAGRLDLAAMDQFWTYGFTIGRRTIYEQIRKLGSAEHLTWRQGRIELRRYWDCPFGFEPSPDKNIDEWADELEELLCDAIRKRLVSDVPLGLFLSGGIDSGVLAALAARKLGRAVDAYTIAFSESGFDESPYARQIAGHLGLNIRTLTVDEEMANQFGAIADQFDEPFGDSSAIPTYFVSKIARRHVTVALTGDGGDELFAGYDLYKDGLRLWGNAAQRKTFRRKLTTYERYWHAKLRLLGVRRGFDLMQSQSSVRHRRRLYGPAMEAAVAEMGKEAGRERREAHERVSRSDCLSRMQYVSLKINMVDDILAKVDRMSMANGLECRSPLLDYRVVEFASKLPYSAKMGETGKGKAVMRRILSRYAPEGLYDRPKLGFCAPWEKWCRGELGRRLRERWKKQEGGMFRADAAEMLFPDGSEGSAFRQWQAFALMQFMDRAERK